MIFIVMGWTRQKSNCTKRSLASIKKCSKAATTTSMRPYVYIFISIIILTFAFVSIASAATYAHSNDPRYDCSTLIRLLGFQFSDADASRPLHDIPRVGDVVFYRTSDPLLRHAALVILLEDAGFFEVIEGNNPPGTVRLRLDTLENPAIMGFYTAPRI